MFAIFMDAVAHASLQSYIGVGLIFGYFVIMVSAIAYRVKKGDHISHH